MSNDSPEAATSDKISITVASKSFSKKTDPSQKEISVGSKKESETNSQKSSSIHKSATFSTAGGVKTASDEPPTEE